MQYALIKQRKAESEQQIILKLLEQVESDRGISQARFAAEIGIAKGLANLYFNRCLQKGWIKLKHVPRRRYLYYVTPKGFVEKARLTVQFLSYSYQFYREIRADLVATLETAGSDGCKRIVVLGAGELAEIAAIVVHGTGAKVVGFVAAGAKGDSFLGLPIAARWSDLAVAADAALLATLENTRQIHADFRAECPAIPVYVPGKLQTLIGG